MPLEHALEHSRGRGRQISESKINPIYRASSRTARTAQRNPVSKINNFFEERENRNPLTSKSKPNKESLRLQNLDM